jgi:hypothetical protein
MQILRRGIMLVVTGLVVVAATACSGDDDDADAGPEGEAADRRGEVATDAGERAAEGDLCGLFGRIEALDDESQTLVDESLGRALSATDPEEREAAFAEFASDFAPFAEERIPELVDTYDQLAEVVPDRNRDDVELLRDFTAGTLEAMASAESVADLQEALTGDLEAATAAGEATLRLDELSRDRCDVVLAD